jgi:hypothetical protein
LKKSSSDLSTSTSIKNNHCDTHDITLVHFKKIANGDSTFLTNFLKDNYKSENKEFIETDNLDSSNISFKNLKENTLGSSNVCLREEMEQSVTRKNSFIKLKRSNSEFKMIQKENEKKLFNIKSTKIKSSKKRKRRQSLNSKLDLNNFRNYIKSLPSDKFISKYELSSLMDKFFK